MAIVWPLGRRCVGALPVRHFFGIATRRTRGGVESDHWGRCRSITVFWPTITDPAAVISTVLSDEWLDG